jgi:hypothetical protein
LLEDAAGKTFLIVDEGPGLSGSSFFALTSWLTQHGIERQQIWLMPSHPGLPGVAAGERARRSYEHAQRVHVSFEELCLRPQAPLCLRTAFEDLTGRTEEPLEDLSAGKWRARVFGTEAKYPASHPQQERRKYLLNASGRKWLLKFEGLGERGMTALARGRALYARGFSPEMVALRRGFSLTSWLADGRPLSLVSCDRGALVDRVAEYITFVAERFGGMPPAAGAGPSELARMVRHNACELVAPELASVVRKIEEWVPELNRMHRTTATDNRMDAHEWILLPTGQLLKTDALNHHASHDCIGCQDPTWDVVSACFELGFSDAERERLRQRLSDRSLCPTAHQWSFYELAYYAFRAGFYTLAKSTLAPCFPAEISRLQVASERYTNALAQRLLALVHA